jgi:hypothetical protein
MRVNYLDADDDGVRVVATPLHHLGSRLLTPDEKTVMKKTLKNMFTIAEWKAAVAALPAEPEQPWDFTMRWQYLHLCGSAINVCMMPDHLYTDPAVVAEVKAAAVPAGSVPRRKTNVNEINEKSY